jgi:biotin synthase
MRDVILELENQVISGSEVSFDEAVRLLKADNDNFMFLFASANRIRRHYCGDDIHLCGIVNAKSGACSEDCVFCAQSARHETGVTAYSLMNSEAILRAAKKAEANGARSFGIVAAWRGIREGEALDSICRAIRRIKKETSLVPDVSLGLIDSPNVARRLGEAGAGEYNINLEAGPGFFPKLCSTHAFEERVKTIEYIKRAGMRVCCGGIMGLGETVEQRVELAMELRKLNVDTVPLNFYHHVEGNPVDVEATSPLGPLEALKTVAVFRFILPKTTLKIAGGRETTLGEFQSMMFLTGANATMVGHYLTTKGRNAEEDLALIRECGMKVSMKGC